jgi:3-isopropylmalate dehydrogenase
MDLRILTVPGDGIGTEVTHEAVRVLERVCSRYGHQLHLTEALLGGIAIHKTGNPFPEETRKLALEADATLMGAVGLPEFDKMPPDKRPEKGLLGIRQAMGVYANLRPVRTYSALIDSSPLKNHLVEGTDMIIVRELTGGIYYGTPRGITGEGHEARASTPWPTRTMKSRGFSAWPSNSPRAAQETDQRGQIQRARVFAALAQGGAGNRARVPRCHPRPPVGGQLRHAVGAEPRRFDVLVTENMFGDILSDEGAVLAGSIGMLPSASLGDRKPSGVWVGLYEPVHGSAPDIAGQGKANPLGAIGSVAAMLEYSFGLKKEAAAVNAAMEQVLNSGRVTADLKPKGAPATTSEVGTAVCEAI